LKRNKEKIINTAKPIYNIVRTICLYYYLFAGKSNGKLAKNSKEKSSSSGSSGSSGSGSGGSGPKQKEASSEKKGTETVISKNTVTAKLDKSV